MKYNFNKPYITGNELSLIKKVFENNSFYGSGYFTRKATSKIQKILDAKYVLLTDSCTSALEISALLIDKKPHKNEVIMPSYTFSSTANAFLKHGFKVKFVDIDPANMMINPSQISKLVNSKTVAVVGVHYGSHLVDSATLKEICKKNKIFFIEDAAQAFGSKLGGKSAGTFGDFGCFSFHETKNIHCGMGGAFVTNSKKSFDKATMIWERGSDRQKLLLGLVDKYTWREIGGSYYPSELQAAFLCAQLDTIKENIKKRRQIYERYASNLKDLIKSKNITFPALQENHTSNYHSFYVFLESKDKCKRMREYLKACDIQAVTHYVPLHNSPVGKKIFKGKLENTEKYSNKLLRLPFHNYLKLKDIDFICERIINFFNSNGK